jgi:hypothetical protein
MSMDDLTDNFFYLLRFVPYIREDNLKILRFLRNLPRSYKDKIEFENPKSLNDVFRKVRMCHNQYKQRFGTPKACKDRKKDKLNQ